MLLPSFVGAFGALYAFGMSPNIMTTGAAIFGMLPVVVVPVRRSRRLLPPRLGAHPTQDA